MVKWSSSQFVYSLWKLPLEKIGRLAALLFRRLQDLLYSEQLLRSTISDMGIFFKTQAKMLQRGFSVYLRHGSRIFLLAHST